MAGEQRSLGGDAPFAGGLGDGVIDLQDLEGLDVHVFVTHPHTDHYDPVILSWQEAAPSIHYYFGWEAGEDPDHLDLVFHVGLTDDQWQYARQGYWLMDHLHPDGFFPMHFGGEEERGAEFARVMAERGYDTAIPVPRRRGDSWRAQ